MARVADRRVHLQPRAEPRIVVGVEGQVLRRHLDGGDVLVGAEEVHLLGGRDVQHVDARAGLAGDAHQPLGGAQRRGLVAPDRMRGRIALGAAAAALDQARLVLGVERDAPPGPRQDRAQALVVGDQQVAGRGAHEDLDPGSARQPLQLAGYSRHCRGCRRRRRRSRNACGPVARRTLSASASAVVVERVGVGHLEDGRDAAHDRGARPGLEVFLVLGARLAEMDLGVDDARQDVQAGAVDDLAGRRAGRSSPSAAIRPSRTPMSRMPAPSWLTTVAPVKTTSKVSAHHVDPCPAALPPLT